MMGRGRLPPRELTAQEVTIGSAPTLACPGARHGRRLQGGDPARRHRGRDDRYGDAGCSSPGGAAGQNLIVTQEPTFYTGGDPGHARGRPVTWRRKASSRSDACRLALLDHWNARKPNEFATAARRHARLERHGAGRQQIYRLPRPPWAALMAHVRSPLGIRGGLRRLATRHAPPAVF